MASSVLAYCCVIIFVHGYNRSNFNLFSSQKSKHIRLTSNKESILFDDYDNNIIYGNNPAELIYIEMEETVSRAALVLFFIVERMKLYHWHITKIMDLFKYYINVNLGLIIMMNHVDIYNWSHRIGLFVQYCRHKWQWIFHHEILFITNQWRYCDDQGTSQQHLSK